MDFVLHPLKGANDLEFGMDEQTVHRRMGIVPEKFRQHDQSFASDHYVDEGALAYYDDNGHLEAFEVTEPSRALLGGVDILALPVRQALAFVKQFDPDAVIDHEGATSHKYSLAIWCPHLGDEEDEEPVEAVLVGRANYYPLPTEP
jgi:hypothetical protein